MVLDENVQDIMKKNQIGNRVTLCQKIDKIKHQYFSHISRREGDNLKMIIAQGHVEGKRKRGRQKVRWAMVSERSQDWMFAKPIGMLRIELLECDQKDHNY